MANENIENKESSNEITDSGLLGKLFAGMENSDLLKEENQEGGEGKTETEIEAERLEAERKQNEEGQETPEEKETREAQEAADKLEEEEGKKKAAGQTVEDEDSVIVAARTRFGVEDLEGEFDETVDGLLDLTEKVIEKKEADARVAGRDEYLNNNPEIKLIAEHLDAGGSLVTLIQKQQVADYSKIEIKDDDIDTQEKFYRAALLAKNVDEDEIDGLVATAKDTGKLLEKGKAGKDFIVAQNQKIIDAQIKQEQDAHKAELDSIKAIEDEVRKTIKSGNINGLKLSATEQAELENFALTKDATGKAPRDEAYDKLTTEQWLLLDRIVMNGFKGLGITPRQTTGKPLKELARREKTVDLGGAGGGGGVAVKGFEQVKGIKDLLGKEE